MHALKSLLIIFLTLLCSKTTAQDLDTYKWNNRIIILKESNLESDWLKAQVKRLQSDLSELNDRQLVVFILTNGLVYDLEQNETDLDAKIIEEQFAISNFEGLMLIGKDGSIKLKEAFIVNPKTIFELIDSMPMRKNEMNRN